MTVGRQWYVNPETMVGKSKMMLVKSGDKDR